MYVYMMRVSSLFELPMCLQPYRSCVMRTSLMPNQHTQPQQVVNINNHVAPVEQRLKKAYGFRTARARNRTCVEAFVAAV